MAALIESAYCEPTMCGLDSELHDMDECARVSPHDRSQDTATEIVSIVPKLVSFLDMPKDIMFRIQLAVGDAPSVYGIDAVSAGMQVEDDGAWATALEALFPTLFSKLCAEAFSGSYKQVFTRRVQRAEVWRRRKEGPAALAGCAHDIESPPASAAAPSKRRARRNEKVNYGGGQSAFSDSTLRIKVCHQCGEKYKPTASRAGDCLYHSGVLEATGQEARGLSRLDRQQIAKYARIAVKTSGGAASRRSGRGGGHWTKGLGLPRSIGGKIVLWDWEGGEHEPSEVSCRWSCCDGSGLFATGCMAGQHRHNS